MGCGDSRGEWDDSYSPGLCMSTLSPCKLEDTIQCDLTIEKCDHTGKPNSLDNVQFRILTQVFPSALMPCCILYVDLKNRGTHTFKNIECTYFYTHKPITKANSIHLVWIKKF